MTNWDNFRFVLAVARMGSALRAARALGVDQTTVVRRISQMEDSFGGILFERRQSGLQITPLGERIHGARGRLACRTARGFRHSPLYMFRVVRERGNGAMLAGVSQEISRHC